MTAVADLKSTIVYESWAPGIYRCVLVGEVRRRYFIFML